MKHYCPRGTDCDRDHGCIEHEHDDRREAWVCMHPHAHRWNEDDYCDLCGADGRA